MKILGYKYRIRKIPDLSVKDGAVGDFDARSQIIRIDSKVSDDQQKETLIHEILEAIKYHLDYEKMSHQMLSSFSVALYSIIKDNPKYFTMRLK